MPPFPNDNGFFSFLVTYRKVLRVLFIADLIILPLKIIYATDTNTGYWIHTIFTFGLIPIVGLILVHKAVKDSSA